MTTLGFHPSLPSSVTAARLVSGDLSALPYMARDLVGRAALIALGASSYRVLRGEQVELREVAPLALAGSASIEVFVLAYTWYSGQSGSR